MIRASSLLAALCCLLLRTEPCHAEPSASSEPFERSTVERCVAGHENARLLRVQEDWLAARVAMQGCASESCPLSIRSDCAAWLDELERALPTVLLVIERDDDGKQPLQLEIDGQRVNLPSVVGPLEVLPGEHVLRVTLPPFAPIERRLRIEKGEKNRLVHVRFTRPARAPAPPASLAPVATRPVPIASYVFAGTALAAVATSTALLISALAERDSARAACSPLCDRQQRDSIEMRLMFADVAGGAGVVAGGLALITFLTRPVVYEPAQGGAPASPVGADLRLKWRF